MKDSSKGQTLVEVILAIAVASLILIGLTRATTIALRNAQFAKNHVLATQYAQKAMERLRAYRDQNDWSTFSQESNCENPPGLGSIPSGFSRNIDCNVSADLVEVTITVSWNSHQTELVTFLTKWE